MTSARLLVARPLARTVPWPALAVSMLGAVLLVWHFRTGVNTSESEVALALRLAAVTLAVGLSFVLDDPTEDLTAPSPVSLGARRSVRIAMTMAPAVAAWTLLAWWSNAASFAMDPPHFDRLIVEMAALGAVGLAGASWGARHLADGLGGPAGASAVVLMTVVAAMFPWGHPLLARLPRTGGYVLAQRWWWIVVLAALVVLVRTSATPGTARLRRAR